MKRQMAAVLATLAVCGYVTHRMARRVEAEHPPTGRFVEVDGVRLHYREYGAATGEPLVLLHGNGTSSEEMELSGLPQIASGRYRVLSFDRPGYGHSDRPSGRAFGPREQARLVLDALSRMGIERPIVLAHSWATQVALAMAIEHPNAVRALVLASGYYFPSLRLDVVPIGTAALPWVGQLLRHTVAPLIGRLLWPLSVRRMFTPAPTALPFQRGYPPWMSLRPRALKASATEAAMLIPIALRSSVALSKLDVPVVVVAGRQDRVASTRWHSQRLAHHLPSAPLNLVEGAGHMVHHTAAHDVARSIDEAAALGALAPS